MYNEALCKYCLVLLSITVVQNIYRILLGFVRYHFHHNILSGITKALKNHLDDPVPIDDFQVLHCLGIISLVSGIDLLPSQKVSSKNLDP